MLTSRQGYSGSDTSTRLHPDHFDHEHIERLETFTQDLQQALQGSFPQANEIYPYSAVTVLLLRWEEDDLNVQTEISQLRELFHHQFHFQTEEWYIPSSPHPTRALQRKLYAFQDAHQGEKELLIVYYVCFSWFSKQVFPVISYSSYGSQASCYRAMSIVRFVQHSLGLSFADEQALGCI